MLEIKLIRFMASDESNVISCLFLNILIHVEDYKNMLFRKYTIMNFMDSPNLRIRTLTPQIFFK